MTELNIREKTVEVAKSFLGCKESDGSHKQIIDIYNSQRPNGGYKMTYTDPWCATYVSSVGIKCGLSDIILRECSCDRMITLYKNAGRWIEADDYVPMIADVVFYDWDDNGVGENTGYSEHVGMIASINGTTMTVIEGNKSDSVEYRTLKVNGRYIRGYGIPNYASKVNSDDDSFVTPVTPTTKPNTSINQDLKYSIGDIVKFTGNTHYRSSNSNSAINCISGTAKVTAVSKDAKHPYHLIAEKGKGSTVYGWVDEADISDKISSTAGNGTGVNINVNSNAKVDCAKSRDESLTGSYKATANLNMRAGAGTSKAVITIIQKGDSVNCYGYYTLFNGTKWYYVTYKKNSVQYNGFVSSKYLT